jgi:hypothetical protein
MFVVGKEPDADVRIDRTLNQFVDVRSSVVEI